MFESTTPRHENRTANKSNNGQQLGQDSSSIVPVGLAIPKIEPEYPGNESLSTSFDIDEGDTAIPFITPYKLKDPTVVLERCDKIWETLKLIKNVQKPRTHRKMRNVELQSLNTRNNLHASHTNASSSTKMQSSTTSYIKYQPVLNNGNVALPNFKFAVKSTRKLYHCVTCGKQYTENRTLRHHSYRVHGIFIPPRQRGLKYSTQSIEDFKNNLTVGEKLGENGTEKDICKDMQSEKVSSRNSLHKEQIQQNINIQASRSRRSHNTQDVNSKYSQISKCNVDSVQKSDIASASLIDQSVPCTLCKQSVKSLRTHLTKYHKIGCPEIMIKELDKSLCNNDLTHATLRNKELKYLLPQNEIVSDTSQSEHKTIQKKEETIKNNSESNIACKQKRKCNASYYDSRKRRRTQKEKKVGIENTTNSQSYSTSAKDTLRTVQCDICFGKYAPSTMSKHMRRHRLRGHKKEDFHIFKEYYEKSPDRKLRDCTFVRLNNKDELLKPRRSCHLNKINGNDDKSNNTKDDTIQTPQELSILNIPITRSHKRQHDQCNTCDCGRSFRDPHTLYVHKSKCIFNDHGYVQTYRRTRSNSDRDSAIGINITIKKNNNSYEIVNKDSNNENNCNDSGNFKDNDGSPELAKIILEDSNDATLETEIQPFDNADYSKYSRNHSILKLQHVDEDIDVDIETELQINSSCEGDKLNTICNSLSNEEEENENVHNTDSKMHKGRILSLTQLCKQVLLEYEIKKSNAVILNKKQKKLMCTCGARYKYIRNSNVHIRKKHPLLLQCGYCKKKLSNIVEYNSHNCQMKKGKPFFNLKTRIVCHFCNNMFPTIETFEEHIKREHFDAEFPYQCYYCVQKFSEITQREVHNNLVHSKTVCSICDKKLHSTGKLIHEAYHDGCGYPCHSCKKAYPTVNKLLKHFFTLHEGKKNIEITCAICSKFVQRRSFLSHISKHNKQEQCKVCRRQYYSKELLEKHISTKHSDYYPYLKCNNCGMLHISKDALLKHIDQNTCVTSEKREVA